MPQNWLLLLHQIPPNPPYLRAKVLRRLNQMGALSIKNSAYVIPETDETMEDIQWLRFEATKDSGETWLFRATPLAGLSEESLVASFLEARGNDYKQLLEFANGLLQGVATGALGGVERRKLQRRYEEIRCIDFFEAPERKEVESIMEKIDQLVPASRQPISRPDLKDLNDRIWVTRRGVKVDRIATAWLIRRFIDPEAQFRFVDPDRYKHAKGEVRFDMFEGEFTHEGDLCTFEALLHYAGLDDPGLNAVAEIVHDIDIKDQKYQRPETNGIAAMISGIAALESQDERRIAEGGRIFEAAYAGLKAARPS